MVYMENSAPVIHHRSDIPGVDFTHCDAGHVLDVEPGDVLVLPDGTTWTVDFLRQGSWVDLHNIRLTQLEEVAA